MTVTTFPSSYGNYTITRAELACQPTVNSEGTTCQNVITFETSTFPDDDQQPVRVVAATLFRAADGHTFSSSYQGQQRTVSREEGRRQYRRVLQEGYSPAIDRLF
jgi:hypothetical protein